MRPLPDESGSKLKSARSAKRGSRDEMRRLADRIIAYGDLDRENDADVTELIDETRRRLLRAHAIRSKRKKKN